LGVRVHHLGPGKDQAWLSYGMVRDELRVA